MSKAKKSPTITIDEWISANFTTLPEKPENAVTIAEVSRRTGLSESQVNNTLNKLVREGKLTMGKCNVRGKVCNYYIPK